MGGPSSGSTAGSRRANCARRVATVMARNPEGPDLDLPRLWHGPRPGPQRSQEHPGGRAGRYCLWTRCKTQPKPGGRGRSRNHPGRCRISPVRNPRPSGRGGSQWLTGDWTEAEELAQEAMVRTWWRWSIVRGHDRPHDYARKVLVNRHRSLLRRALARRSKELGPAAEDLVGEIGRM